MSRRSTVLLVGVLLAGDLCLALALALNGDVDPSLAPEEPALVRPVPTVPAGHVAGIEGGR